MAAQPDRTRYRRKLATMLRSPPTFSDDDGMSSIERQAHWAKYSCVLVSGFVEQAVKEILVSHAHLKSAPHVGRYIENTWPSSKNMNVGNISNILANFDDRWKTSFDTWLTDADERKATINNLISWRNNIAHGKEGNTTGVTIASVNTSFECACKFIDFLEGLAAS